MAIDFTINGNRYTNDPALVVSAGIPPEHQFIGYNATLALESLSEDIVAVGSGSTAAAAASAALAQAFAASAVAAPGTSATSTTSLTTAYGAQALTIQAGKAFSPGSWLTLASAANPDGVQMSGPITAHNSGTGAVAINVKTLSTIGATATDWIVSVSAPGGASLGFNQYSGSQFYAAGIFEGSVAMGASSTVDLSAGSNFSKTATAPLTLAVTGIPAGASSSFLLKLTNGGAYAVTYPAGSVFAAGAPPVLTASGVDRLGFIKDAGGVWEIYVIGRDVK